jgi:hypothetical protein
MTRFGPRFPSGIHRNGIASRSANETFELSEPEPDGQIGGGGQSSDFKRLIPKALTKHEIQSLMKDFGRQTLHTLLSDAIDSLIELKRIKAQLTQRWKDDTADSRSFGIELSYALGLWRLRIETLQMISEAQSSLRHSRGPRFQT